MGNRSKRGPKLVDKPNVIKPALLTMKAAICPWCMFVLKQDGDANEWAEKIKAHSCECPKHPLVQDNKALVKDADKHKERRVELAKQRHEMVELRRHITALRSVVALHMKAHPESKTLDLDPGKIEINGMKCDHVVELISEYFNPDEAVMHSHRSDVLHEDHYLAHEMVHCDACPNDRMVHASNNECMQTWFELPNKNYYPGLGIDKEVKNVCGECFAKILVASEGVF